MIRYLTTLDLPDGWLEALRAAVPGVEVRRIVAEAAEQVPDPVWAEVDVLHTHSAIPDPPRAPRLRWVQLDTAGIDHLVGHPIWATGVPVTTLAGVSAEPIAEYVMMMMLARQHHLRELIEGQRAHEWPPVAERFARYRPRRTAGRTMVIVGYGRIGREIGRLATAFGMTVLGVSRSGRREESGVVEVLPVSELHAALPRADVLVLVTPLTPQTRGLIGDDELAILPLDALLIDVGRGGVVDPEALRAALSSRRLSAAALDVFDPEPMPHGDPLWDDPRVFVSPHVAGFSPLYHEDVLSLVTENLQRLRADEPLRNRVDPANGY